MWDVTKAVAYLDDNASEHSLGKCAQYVRKAIEAGGVVLVHHLSAKDYGSSLEKVRFFAMSEEPAVFVAGDVAVIQPIAGHPHGHMTMYDGTIWVSDFKQYHGYYPGPGYRKLKPSVTFYRYPTVLPAVLSSITSYARLA